MGFEYAKKPGAGPSHTASSSAGWPGKRTLTDQLPANTHSPLNWLNNTQTGSPIVDQGTLCMAEPQRPDCILTPQQRMLLIPTYQTRVNAAALQYMSALQQVRVDELLKAEEAPKNWMFELFLDVIGYVAIGAALKAFQAIKSGNVHIEGIPAQTVANAARSESDTHAAFFLNTAVGIGKKKAGGELAKADARPTTAKSSKLAFLDLLGNRAAGVFETLREQAIAGVSDAVLLVMFESFRSVYGHTLGDYKDAIQAQLQRFEQSGVNKIGITQPISGSALDLYARQETKVFWVRTPMGLKLGLYTREHQPIPDQVLTLKGARKASPIDKVIMEQRDLASRPFRFVGYVPHEFVTAAITMHETKWGAPPTETTAGVHEIMQMGSA